MGGGGGFFSSKPEDLVKRLKASDARVQDDTFETEVGEAIARLLSDYNDRDVDAINGHIETIKQALDKDIDGTVGLVFGGSVAKHTYVDGMSDVDALVILNDTDLEGLSPDRVKDYFRGRLKERLPQTPVDSGSLAVTVKFGDIDVQLLPALRHGDKIEIAASNGTEWSVIDPTAFTERLTSRNKSLGNKLIPTIKLAKSVIQELPESRQLTGYHTEALALAVFQDYAGPITPKAMLTHFFSEAPQYVLAPIKDPTGQSDYVDDYLGPADSPARLVVATSLLRIGRRMHMASTAKQASLWRDILGDQVKGSNG